MTALHAAGGGLVLAFRIPHVVEQAGSLAGFAAVGGLAILSALYFSQARDLRRLREWAGRAPERAAEGQAPASPVPGRVVAVPQRTPQAVQAPVPVASAGAAGAGATAAPPAPQQGGSAAANGAPPAEGEAAEKGEGDEKPEVAETAAEQGDGAATDADKAGDGEGEEKGDGEGDKAAEGDKPEGGDGSGASAPGMPAPASAAAAAGAGAASASAPSATPGGIPPAPKAPPAPAPAAPASGPSTAPRTPGSVLPPRTGAVQPVRRLPAGTARGNAAISPGAAPSGPPERRKRNPVYVALAVIGVLVLGAGAAVGVPKLVNGGTSTKPAKKHKKGSTTTAAKVAPIATKDITVAVLNGTTVPGLAAQIGDQVQNDGFNLGTVSNAPQQQRANSVAMYAAGHQRDARVVARKLKIAAVEPVDSNSQQIAGDATVVVIVGRDQTH